MIIDLCRSVIIVSLSRCTVAVGLTEQDEAVGHDFKSALTLTATMTKGAGSMGQRLGKRPGCMKAKKEGRKGEMSGGGTFG